MNPNKMEEYSEYFQKPEFKALFNKYETIKKSGQCGYFDADELIDIAEYYYNKRNKEAAIDTLEYASRIHPDNIDVKIFKARTYMLEDDFEAAENIVDTIIDKTDREVLFLRAEMHICQGDIPEAEKFFNQIIENEDETEGLCQTMVEIGELFIDYTEFEKGYHYLMQAEKQASTCEYSQELAHDILANKAICLFGTNKRQEAIKLVNKILDDNPYSYEHWCMLGEFYMEMNEFDKAIDAFDYALAIHTDCCRAIFWEACCFTKLNNISQALELFKQCIDKDYKKSEAHFGCGLLYNATGFYTKAIEHLHLSEKDMAETPSCAIDLYLNLAEAYIQSEQSSKAQHYIRLAEDISPENEQTKELYKLIKFMKERLKE